MQKKSLESRYNKYGYLFSLPFVLVYLAFSLYPLLYTTIIGFTDLRGIGRTDFQFLANPLENFQAVLNNSTFQQAFWNTIVMWLINFFPQMLLALLLTVWFTSRHYKVRGQGAFKVMFYMPNIITAASVALLFSSLFQYPSGPVNYLLNVLGVTTEPVNFMIDRWTARLLLSFIQFWMWYGYTMLILISGVLGMNTDMFEAADIDGANGVQTFFRITLPNLRPIMLYTLITSMIGGLNMFDMPRMLIQGGLGGPDNATITTSLFTYLQAFAGTYLYNRAAAASMLMFLLIAILSAIVFYLMRDKDAAASNKNAKLAAKARRAAR